jgi:2-phospho-L-lactate guanylyltransferase
MLKPVEREQLTVAMLKDVLFVLRRSRQVRSVTVVSADRNARSISRRFGADFLWEGKRRGLNKGLKLAISNSERRGASSVLVIHSDLPLLKPREIDEFLEQSQGYSVSLTPSKDGAGTNALLLRPPRVIRPAFGRDSFRRHLSLAMRTNARSRVLRFKGISFDVDKPRDLVNLIRRPLRNETGRFLRTLRKRS